MMPSDLCLAVTFLKPPPAAFSRFLAMVLTEFWKHWTWFPRSKVLESETGSLLSFETLTIQCLPHSRLKTWAVKSPIAHERPSDCISSLAFSFDGMHQAPMMLILVLPNRPYFRYALLYISRPLLVNRMAITSTAALRGLCSAAANLKTAGRLAAVHLAHALCRCISIDRC